MSPAAARSARAAWLARTLRVDLATAELFRSLADVGVDAILLRGPVIARALYAHTQRPYTDSDLLVCDAQRPAAVQVLRELGYRGLAANPFAQHWRRPADAAEVDLHRKLWGCTGSPERLYAALDGCRTPFQLQDVTVSALSEPALALVLALHVSQHGMLFSRTLNDLELAVEHFGCDSWHQAAELAHQVGALAAFRQGLSMVPTGVTLLQKLSLTPTLSVQAVLRRRGIDVPFYLCERLSLSERLGLLHLLIIAAGDDDPTAPAGDSGALRSVWALARSGGDRVRWYCRLVSLWRSARGEAAAFNRHQA